MKQTSHPHLPQMGMPSRARTCHRPPRLLKSLQLSLRRGVPRPPTPPRRSRETSAQTKFDERPPLSPLPALTPRKTWPPSRTAAHALIAEESNDDEDDEEDEMTYLRVQSLTHLRPLRLLLLAHDESKNRNDDGDKYSQQTRSRGNAWTVRVRSYRHPHVL